MRNNYAKLGQASGVYADRLALACTPFFLVAIGVPHLDFFMRGSAFWAFVVISYVVIPAFVLVVALKSCGLTMRGLGLHPLGSWQAAMNLVIWSVVISIVLIALNSFATMFLSSITRADVAVVTQSRTDWRSMQWVGKALFVVYVVIIASVVEEVFYRAMLHEVICGLVNHWSRTIYVIASTMLFGLAHLADGMVSFGVALYMGLFLSVMYVYLNDLRPLIAAHGLLNLYWILSI